MLKKGLVVLLTLALLGVAPLSALGAGPDPGGFPVYLNLGDSIAVGLSADPGQSYFDRYARTMKPGPALNISREGLTTGLMGGALLDPGTQGAIGAADVITISIGGNNLLSPVIVGAFGAYGLTYGDADLDDLMMAIALGGEDVWNANVAGLTWSAVEGDLAGALELGKNAFLADWPVIIGGIRGLNPDARIMVLNLYNPVDPLENPALFAVMQGHIDQMNGALAGAAAVAGYQVADVQGAFGMEPGAVDFSLVWETLSLDPHPTTLGHELIFRELMDLTGPRGVLRGRKPAAAGLPAVHEVDGRTFGAVVSEEAREDPGALADHASSKAAGIPGHPGGREFGTIVRDFDKAELVSHLTGR